MNRLKAIAIGIVLLATPGKVHADVVYSNFTASNGYNKTDAVNMLELQPFPPVKPSVSSFVAVPFQVPPGINYTLTEVDVAVSVPNGSTTSAVGIEINGAFIGDSVPVSVPPGGDSTLPQLIQIFTTPATLNPGLNTITMRAYDARGGATVNWYLNNAGVEGDFSASHFTNNDPTLPMITRGSTGRLPVFRILGEILDFDSPPIRPAYSSLATTQSSNATSVVLQLEVVCPGPHLQISCPVGVPLSSPVTPAQACVDAAAAINYFAATASASSCLLPTASAQADPSQFHADCDGDSVRVTNSTAGLCAGAFVSIDGIFTWPPPVGIPVGPVSFETDAATAGRFLTFGGTTGGPIDPSFGPGLQIVWRRSSSGQTFSADVRIPAGSTPGQIGSALAAALSGASDEISATATGLSFQPREPSDLTVWVHVSGVSWALSPLTDLLARSSLSTSPAPVVQATCASGPNRLCLRHRRFQVEASWHTPQGTSGDGLVAAANDESGSFSFFAGDNVEIVAKIVDACAFSSQVWFFAAGMTNVGVDLAVTDTLTGQVHQYHNAAGTVFQPIIDTGTLGGCPVS
jgi:hypothetical protein